MPRSRTCCRSSDLLSGGGTQDHAHACARRLDKGGQHAAHTRVLCVCALAALKSCCALAVEHAGGTHTSELPCDCLFACQLRRQHAQGRACAQACWSSRCQASSLCGSKVTPAGCSWQGQNHLQEPAQLLLSFRRQLLLTKDSRLSTSACHQHGIYATNQTLLHKHAAQHLQNLPQHTTCHADAPCTRTRPQPVNPAERQHTMHIGSEHRVHHSCAAKRAA